MRRQAVLPFEPPQSAKSTKTSGRAVPEMNRSADPQLPAGPVAKLQLLEVLVRQSPGILHEDTRDSFLTVIWLTLAELGALPPAPGKAA